MKKWLIEKWLIEIANKTQIIRLNSPGTQVGVMVLDVVVAADVVVVSDVVEYSEVNPSKNVSILPVSAQFSLIFKFWLKKSTSII